jgi:hypothetical protein
MRDGWPNLSQILEFFYDVGSPWTYLDFHKIEVVDDAPKRRDVHASCPALGMRRRIGHDRIGKTGEGQTLTQIAERAFRNVDAKRLHGWHLDPAMVSAAHPDSLATAHLFDVDFELGEIDFVGQTPIGQRVVGNLGGGRFAGERLRGRVLPSGGDWGLFHPDGTLAVDGRCIFQAEHEGGPTNIYGIYKGRWCIAPEVMAGLNTKEEIEAHDPSSYSLRIHWLFEAPAAGPFAWMNRVIAVGVGRRIEGGIAYRLFEIR